MEEFSCVLIQRNRKWFENAVKHIEHTWNTILTERVDGYEHRAAKNAFRKLMFLSTMVQRHILQTYKKSSQPAFRLDEDGNVYNKDDV